MVRHVLQLPAKNDEAAFRVELVVGKMMEVDPVNTHFFGGQLKPVTVEGWGYTRYVLDELGPLAGTLIAPPPGAGKVERFVTTGGEPFLIRYNSKLPVVIYVPEGAEVRYRIWSAQAEFAAVDKG